MGKMLANKKGYYNTDTFKKISSYYLFNEQLLVPQIIGNIQLSEDQKSMIHDKTANIIQKLRDEENTLSFIDKLLQEYGLSSDEGVILMRLSEALVRTVDTKTAQSLIRDKLSDGDWKLHAGHSASFIVNKATNGLQFSSQWIKATGGKAAENLWTKLGDPALHAAMKQAMRIMGNHFVLGRDISEALINRKAYNENFICFSYDMLGEAAFTHDDAERYFKAYENAVLSLVNGSPYGDIRHAPNISIKLSALHPRYEITHAEHCVPSIFDKLLKLCSIAKEYGFGITIDAEECERLELSLIIIEKLCASETLNNWNGLTIVIQAYQKRALPVIEHIIDLTKKYNRKLMVRLVKGAYWDSEIKRAQEMGLSDYPVFTRKENSDLNYIACAQRLISAADMIYPQFATHNAQTAITVATIAKQMNVSFEFQRLHGMGEQLHNYLIQEYNVKSRIYAPVGPHKDLLPYLVRRLLENGANSSFVNQLSNVDLDIEKLLESPINIAENNGTHSNPSLPSPLNHLENGRKSARGFDWMQCDNILYWESVLINPPYVKAALYSNEKDMKGDLIERFSPFQNNIKIGEVQYATIKNIKEAIESAKKSSWKTNYNNIQRAAIIREIAYNLQEAEKEIIPLLVWEAGKSVPDALAEIREAVDFCRYYADQAEQKMDRTALGIVACISPWNFPLAIYLGQIVAALSMGNCVIAKPAEQTPLIAYKINDIIFKSAIPKDAFHLIIGDGALMGNALTSHKSIHGICFTGSTRTAKNIAYNLASTNRADIPFIAETGGINAMIVDSTALIEQVIADVIASAFQSAGQRCSACRLVCVQNDIADSFIAMMKGAMENLQVGSPQKIITDVGPVIDISAQNMINRHIDGMQKHHKNIGGLPICQDIEDGYFALPTAFEISEISDIKQEIFGPVLHVLRFKVGKLNQLIDDINDLGYGLTMGLHTRIDERVEHVSQKANVGNLYVNRNQIGAVVGVQPFGGEGLSGTGPKAGGPHYLNRLSINLNTTVQYGHALSKTQYLTDNEARFFMSAYDKYTLDNLDIIAKFEKYYADTQTDISNIYKQAYEQSLAYLVSEEELPGPTGEKNILSLHPRGNILCMGGDNISELHKQIALALAHYNSVTIIQKNLIDIDDYIFIKRYNRISIIGENQVDNILTYIASVACDGKNRQEIAAIIARLDGPIMPILSAYDDPERYAIERCVTIDTTAAGGNASLLAST